MEEFIKMAAAQLGIDESAAQSATGGLLGILSKQLADGDFSEILNRIPGAAGLLSAESGGDEGGGMMEGLLGQAASMLGGNAGAALDITKTLTSAGLDLEKGGSFVSMFVEFLKDKLGDDLVSKVMEAVPGLSGGN